jgi:hypothetical protein
MAKFCPKCGTEIKEGENFCSNCGNSENSTEQVNTTVTNVKPAGKSKIIAALLGIFLGVFGVHNFYLGYTGKAVAQLLITVLTCGLGAIASEIWGIVEGIMILTGSINTDAEGNPLVD